MITFNELGRYGRFGNQMFQIASTIGLATKHGYEFGFPYWMNYDHKIRFGSNENIDIQSYFKHPLPLAGETDTDRFIQWGYHDINDLEDRTNLSGHMQSEKYFAHCTELIRHYFELKDEKQYINGKAIAIHVRRGDYDDNYHPTMKKDYYEEALLHMPQGLPIYVFSDDGAAAYKMLGDGKHYVTTNHYMIDFAMMRQCTHFILSNSTFCWWAWWLSNRQGKVVAPRNWFGKVAGISSQDIYTEEMLVI